MNKGVPLVIRSRTAWLIAGAMVAGVAGMAVARADEMPTRKPGLWEIRMLDAAT
jgi:hypothetical protein